VWRAPQRWDVVDSGIPWPYTRLSGEHRSRMPIDRDLSPFTGDEVAICRALIARPPPIGLAGPARPSCL
jgi:hypothetical protein